MIWIILFAVSVVAGGAFLAARTLWLRVGVALLGLVAVGAYWTLGRPQMGDMPLDGRIAEIEARERDAPDSVTAEQFLALQQALARRSPDDPAPFKMIGDLYLSNGRLDEALGAYQSALRRDPSFQPAADAVSEIGYLRTGEIDEATRAQLPRLGQLAQTNPQALTSVQVLALIEARLASQPDDPEALRMMGEIYASTGHLDRAGGSYRRALELAPGNRALIKSWADARFKATQAVDAETSKLYQEAYRLDPSDLRIGYLAGIGLWLEGRRPEAEAIWAAVDARASDTGPERQMFAALKEMFGIDPASPPGGAASPPNN